MNDIATDPRVEALLADRMPRPIALAWRRLENERGEKRLRVQECTEILLRTCLAFLIPDYLRGEPVKAVETILKGQLQPSLGTRLELLQAIRKALGARQTPEPFAPEALAWFDRAYDDLSTLVVLRNALDHGRAGFAIEWLAKAMPCVRRVIGSALWLRAYRPFAVVEQKLKLKERTGHLRFLTGVEHATRSVSARWEPELLSDGLYLLAPEADRVLLLSPWIAVPHLEDHADDVYLWDSIKNDQWVLWENHRQKSICMLVDGSHGFESWLGARKEIPFFLAFANPDGVLRWQEAPPPAGGERFEILRQLDAGGMATVHEARDRIFGSTVVLKVLRAELCRDPKLRERFQREARYMHGLLHPHIRQVLDLVVLGDERPAMVMPPAVENLATRFARQALSEDEVLHLARAMLEALAYLHARNLVHRDVKPSNIVFDEAGTALLTDFGIAWSPKESALTTCHGSLGTLAYMAPEQQLPGVTLDGRADVYALAATLHEALTGAPTVDPGKGIEGRLGEVLRAMATREPKERPSAAEALAMLSDEPAPRTAKPPRLPLPPEAIELESTRFRVDERLYQALRATGLDLVFRVGGGAGQHPHPAGIYYLPNDVAVEFIESKRDAPNWRTHGNWHSAAVPVPLRPFFHPER